MFVELQFDHTDRRITVQSVLLHSVCLFFLSFVVLYCVVCVFRIPLHFVWMRTVLCVVLASPSKMVERLLPLTDELKDTPLPKIREVAIQRRKVSSVNRCCPFQAKQMHVVIEKPL